MTEGGRQVMRGADRAAMTARHRYKEEANQGCFSAEVIADEEQEEEPGGGVTG